MRKLIWLVHISLDGFVAGLRGELNWAGANMDDELWEDVNELLSSVDAVVFGRRTYQEFERYWPAVAGNPASSKNEHDFSRWIERMPKTVASRSLTKLAWQNSAVISDGVAEGVSRMKVEAGGDLVMFGSPGLAAHLFEAGVIDELRIDVHPVLLGAGRVLLEGVRERHKLKLVRSRKFGSGVVGLRYVVA